MTSNHPVNDRGCLVVLARPHYIPNPKHRNRPMLSLSLLCIGAALERAGYEVALIDAPSDENYLDKINDYAGSAICLGITAMTTQIPDGLKIAATFRKAAPHVPIVWGGVHPTLFPEQTCLDPLCDIVVQGDGDETIVEIVKALVAKGDLSKIEGIGYKPSPNQVILTPARVPIELNDLPRPAYHLLSPQQMRILSAGAELAIGNATFVHAGRGCPYRCSFCINTIGGGLRRHRVRSAEAILDDIEFLLANYDLQSFLIQDEDFFADRLRLDRFLDGIVERRLSFFWQTSARADDFGSHYIDSNLLDLMISRGLIVLGVGAESGSDRTLKILKKDISVARIRQAVTISSGHKFRLVLSYMIGVPGESRFDMLKTVKEIDYLSRISDNVYVGGPYPFRPYPGSELFLTTIASNLSLPQTLSAWSSHAQTMEGFIDLSQLPWVADAPLVLYFAQIIPFLFIGSREPAHSTRGKFRQGVAKALLYLFRFRLANNIWHLRFEHHFLTAFNRLKNLL